MTKPEQERVSKEILASMGGKFKAAHEQAAGHFRTRIVDDARDVVAYRGLADANVLLYVFGYSSRDETIPNAERAVAEARALDPSSSETSRLSGIIRFLAWDWNVAEVSFQEAIRTNPANLSARHWYSLYLVAAGRFDEAMTQSDEIMKLEPGDDYLVGRGSLLYFQHRFEELKNLMRKAVAADPAVPWPYDWLGMAYNGLEQHEDAIRAYRTGFELSDGTAEVGAGFGHALGLAGETNSARQIADYYASIAEDRYVPPVQRAYIHIGIREYDEAIRLLEQAFKARSWFLCFAKVEPWLDPIRSDPRFVEIVRRMEFPE